jgi:membrane protein DedA with SNARE-associated domain
VGELMARIADLPAPAVYLVAALLVFAETGLIVGIMLPGEATLLFVGFLCFAGPLRPVPAILVMSVAAMGGDALAFVEGQRVGPYVRASGFGRRVGQQRWSRADALLHRYGGRAICVARFIAFARTLVPRLAAMSGLSYRRIVAWDALGVAGQVAASVVLGYAVGSSYARAATLFTRATGALLVLALVVCALVVFGRYLGRHPDPVASFGFRLARWGPVTALDRLYGGGVRWLTERVGAAGALVAHLVLGVLALLSVGAGLTFVINRLVSTSGFPLVDPLVARWMASLRTPELTADARTTLLALRGSVLVAAAAAAGIGLLLHARTARGLADLLRLVVIVGGFVPLAVLAFASGWARPGSPAEAGPLANQVTLATATFGMLAWLISRERVPWAVSVAAWTIAVGVVAVISLARLYVGWNWLSEIVACVLLGGLWVVVFAVAWRTREQARARRAPYSGR